MTVQVSQNNSSVPFIRSGQSLIRDNETLLTDGSRSIPLAFGTVMAKVAASQKWVPLTSLTAANGDAVAQGIFIGSAVAAADLVAGDVVGAPILVGGGCTIDKDQLVLENSLTIDSVFSSSNAATVYLKVTIRDLLAMRGIYLENTIDIDGYES